MITKTIRDIKVSNYYEIHITENVSNVWLIVQITKSHNGNNEIDYPDISLLKECV